MLLCGKCEAAPCKKQREAESCCAKYLREDEAQQALALQQQALAMQRMQAQMMQNMQAMALALGSMGQVNPFTQTLAQQSMVPLPGQHLLAVPAATRAQAPRGCAHLR